jgi:hypothetical protein
MARSLAAPYRCQEREVLWTILYSVDKKDARPAHQMDQSVTPTLHEALQLSEQLYRSGYVVYEIRQDETRACLTREEVERRLGRTER